MENVRGVDHEGVIITPLERFWDDFDRAAEEEEEEILL
jgi:hypothetical protein